MNEPQTVPKAPQVVSEIAGKHESGMAQRGDDDRSILMDALDETTIGCNSLGQIAKRGTRERSAWMNDPDPRDDKPNPAFAHST